MEFGKSLKGLFWVLRVEGDTEVWFCFASLQVSISHTNQWDCNGNTSGHQFMCSWAHFVFKTELQSPEQSRCVCYRAQGDLSPLLCALGLGIFSAVTATIQLQFFPVLLSGRDHKRKVVLLDFFGDIFEVNNGGNVGLKHTALNSGLATQPLSFFARQWVPFPGFTKVCSWYKPHLEKNKTKCNYRTKV